jgi:uncharacterized protein YlxW (UPF0749 family)
MCCVSIFLTTDLVFAMIGIGRQFPLCANISKRHHKNTKQTSQTSKTPTNLLKHVKDTKQSSQTSQRHRTNISNTSNCVTKGSHTCTWW